jgi:hypothetical protein
MFREDGEPQFGQMKKTPKRHFSGLWRGAGQRVNGLHPFKPHQLPSLALGQISLFISAAFMSRLKFNLRPEDGESKQPASRSTGFIIGHSINWVFWKIKWQVAIPRSKSPNYHVFHV